MDEFFRSASSVMTVVSLVTFVGIIVWAFSARRKNDFEAAANLPFDDEIADVEYSAMERKHG